MQHTLAWRHVEDRLYRGGLKYLHRPAWSLAWGAAAGFVVVIAVLFVGSYVANEPLRRHMEGTLNGALKGYTVRVSALEFHPIGFSITLKDLTITPTVRPEVLIAHVPELRASVQWRALLSVHLVADVSLDRPTVYINRAAQPHEVTDSPLSTDNEWQQALGAIYPLKINRLRIHAGDVTYVDDDPHRPLHLNQLNLIAENIRNIRSVDRVYPSDIHIDAIIFDSGDLRVDGRANLLAEPHVGIDADVSVNHVDLTSFNPMLARMNLWIPGNTVSAGGHVEYAPDMPHVHLKHVSISGV